MGYTEHPEDFEAFMKARTARKLDKAFRRLIEQHIQSVQLSQTPFSGSLSSVDEAMIELKALSEHTPTDDQE